MDGCDGRRRSYIISLNPGHSSKVCSTVDKSCEVMGQDVLYV